MRDREREREGDRDREGEKRESECGWESVTGVMRQTDRQTDKQTNRWLDSKKQTGRQRNTRLTFSRSNSSSKFSG